MIRRSRPSPVDGMCLRIVAVFVAHPRWLGFWSIRFYGPIRGRKAFPTYCQAIADMVDRGELLRSYDVDSGYWRYLWIGRQTVPAEIGRDT